MKGVTETTARYSKTRKEPSGQKQWSLSSSCSRSLRQLRGSRWPPREDRRYASIACYKRRWAPGPGSLGCEAHSTHGQHLGPLRHITVRVHSVPNGLTWIRSSGLYFWRLGKPPLWSSEAGLLLCRWWKAPPLLPPLLPPRMASADLLVPSIFHGHHLPRVSHQGRAEDARIWKSIWFLLRSIWLIGDLWFTSRFLFWGFCILF